MLVSNLSCTFIIIDWANKFVVFLGGSTYDTGANLKIIEIAREAWFYEHRCRC